MERTALALLVQDNPACGAAIREAFGGVARCKLQSVDRVATALARIAGGGVEVVILDLSNSPAPEIDQLDTLLKLRGAAPQLPILVICDSTADGLIMRAVRAGTAELIEKQRCATDLGRLVTASLTGHFTQWELARPRLPEEKKGATLVALVGGKGGVGTTTVALNLAAVLASTSKVILAELLPGFGTIAQYFHPHQKARNITQLLKMDPAAIGIPQAEECLWPCKSVPGLKILFGPLAAGQWGDIGPDHVKAILKALSMLADYVVLDLAASLSEANRAAVQDADVLTLVAERDPFSIEAGKRMLETILNWNAPAPVFGAVIVNRSALAVPLDLAEIEIQLAMPILGVIPPAPDLCVAAQKAGAPLALHDPESLAGRSLAALAERISLRR
jgi:pilus assembly protein CpaE